MMQDKHGRNVSSMRAEIPALSGVEKRFWRLNEMGNWEVFTHVGWQLATNFVYLFPLAKEIEAEFISPLEKCRELAEKALECCQQHKQVYACSKIKEIRNYLNQLIEEASKNVEK